MKFLQKLPKEATKFEGKTSEEQFEMLPVIIADNLDEAMLLISTATDYPKEKIEEWGLSELVDVILAIIEVNKFSEVYAKIKKATAQPTAN